jgi:hypothetical protein
MQALAAEFSGSRRKIRLIATLSPVPQFVSSWLVAGRGAVNSARFAGAAREI